MPLHFTTDFFLLIGGGCSKNIFEFFPHGCNSLNNRFVVNPFLPCIGMDHSYPVHEIGMSVDPPALRPSLYAKARVFAIRSCKSNEPKGFKFSKPRGEQKGVVTISNKNLLDPLRAVTGEDWIPGKRYKVRGFWVADAKTMCFDLNEGVQEDFRPVTPSNDAE